MRKRSERADLIAAVKRGEPVATAARRLWVPMSTAYRWMRQATSGGMPLPPLAPPPTFIELVAEAIPPAAMVVRVGAVEIDVRAGFDAALLRAVVSALADGAA